MKRFWRNNGLSIVILGMFFVAFMFGQTYSGWLEVNEDRVQHGQPPHTLSDYLTSAHFAEATMENWESEFLQMGIFVLFTVFLFQKARRNRRTRINVRRLIATRATFATRARRPGRCVAAAGY